MDSLPKSLSSLPASIVLGMHHIDLVPKTAHQLAMMSNMLSLRLGSKLHYSFDTFGSKVAAFNATLEQDYHFVIDSALCYHDKYQRLDLWYYLLYCGQQEVVKMGNIVSVPG